MQKELEPVQQLETRRDTTSAILDEGKAVIGRLDTRVEGARRKVGDSLADTLSYGSVKLATDKSKMY